LNQRTEPGIRFFGLELQLWRIGDSALAPKFNLVNRPNDWQKKLTQKTAAAVSESGLFYQEFWAAFVDYCGKATSFQLPPPPSRHWLSVVVVRGGFSVNLTASIRDKRMECQLWIDRKDGKAAFAQLLKQRDLIHRELGSQVIFDEMAGRVPSKICEILSADPNDRGQWPTIHKWLKERGEAYANCFKPLLNQLLPG
jgi:hypothetical protein